MALVKHVPCEGEQGFLCAQSLLTRLDRMERLEPPLRARRKQ
jgi:hypothetical protein